MKKNIIGLCLAAALLVPGFAMAAETSANAAAAPACDLNVLASAPMTPAKAVAPTGLEGALPAQSSNCCARAQQRCIRNCRATGVFEFSCDPTTCQSSCICNIGP
jgi:hypothetical protein